MFPLSFSVVVCARTRLVSRNSIVRCRCVSATPRFQYSHPFHSFLPSSSLLLPPCRTFSHNRVHVTAVATASEVSSSTDTSHCEHPQVRSARAFLSRDSTSRYSFQRTTLYRIVTTWCAENSLEPFRRLCIKAN